MAMYFCFSESWSSTVPLLKRMLEGGLLLELALLVHGHFGVHRKPRWLYVDPGKVVPANSEDLRGDVRRCRGSESRLNALQKR